MGTKRGATRYEKDVFEHIRKHGVPPGEVSPERTNALTWLKRNGYIRNTGNRSHPNWSVVPKFNKGNKEFIFNRFLQSN